MEACFPEDRYDRVWSGEVWAFVRRDVRADTSPPPLMLLEPPHDRLPIELIEVSDGIWGFMLFDGHSCQLHPNDAGQPPATLAIERDFAGQRRFRTGLALPGKARAAVKFSVEVRQGTDCNPRARGEWVVAPGQRANPELNLPALSGRCRVILRTEMAEPDGDSFHAWAHWLAPQFM